MRHGVWVSRERGMVAIVGTRFDGLVRRDRCVGTLQTNSWIGVASCPSSPGEDRSKDPPIVGGSPFGKIAIDQ